MSSSSSRMPPEDLRVLVQHTEQLLQRLLSGDNQVRGAAEASFNQGLVENPGLLLRGLVGLAAAPVLGTDPASSGARHVRGLAVVLVRRVFVRQPELWRSAIDAQVKNDIRSTLLVALGQQHQGGGLDRSMRRKLCDTISSIGLMGFADDEPWPELLPFMFASVTSPSVEHIENALELFANMAAYVHTHLASEFHRIAALLQNCLSHPDLNVQLAAVHATWGLVLDVPSNSSSNNNNTDEEEADDERARMAMFPPLLASTLQVMSRAIAENHVRAAEPVETLIDLAGSHHAQQVFTKPNLRATLEVVFAIASQSSSSKLRILLLELATTLAETRSAAVRKLAPPENAFATTMYPILIAMMMEIPNLSPAKLTAWGNRYPVNASASTASHHADDDEDLQDEEGGEEEGGQRGAHAFEAALEYVDRVTNCLKAKRTMPILFALATDLLAPEKAGNWKNPHSALLLLAHVVEFTSKKEPELGQLVGAACTFATQNPHPRVRHAALTMIARISYDCAPQSHRKHSQAILSAALQCLGDSCPRVRAHASTALVNFLAVIEDEEDVNRAVKPYLGEIISKLFDCLQSSPRVVQENVLSALSAVATCVGQDFVPYYAQCIPVLKAALENLPVGESAYELLRARLVDCISLIGTSVGRDVFAQDAAWLVHQLQRMPMKKASSGEGVISQHIQVAWMRLSEILKGELEAYLGQVVPFVLEIAQRVLEDEGDADEDEDPSRGGGGGGGTDNQPLQAVRTAEVDEKLLALETLATFALNLESAFHQYMQPTWEIFLRDLVMENCHHDDIRSIVAMGLPDVFRSVLSCYAKGALSAPDFAQYLHRTLEAYCVAMNTEDSLDILKTIVKSLSDVLDHTRACVTLTQNFPPTEPLPVDITPADVETCAGTLMQILRDSIQRRAVAFAEKNCDQGEGEVDEEAEEDFDEEIQAEHELHFCILAAVEMLARANPRAFMTHAMLSEAFGSFVYELAHPHRLCHDQKLAMFFLDDALEYCHTDALRLGGVDFVTNASGILIGALGVEKSSSPTEPVATLANLHQAAAYGLGVCAQRFGNEFAKCAEAAAQLSKVLRETPTDLRYDHYDFGSALDNCASALGHIAYHCNARLVQEAGVNPDVLFEQWLAYFPLHCDVSESLKNSALLVKMMAKDRVPYFWSPSGMQRVVPALAQVLGTEYMADADVTLAIDILGEVKRTMGDAAFLAVVQKLPQEQLTRLKELQ